MSRHSMTIDDIEQQKYKVRKPKQKNEISIVEQAYLNTARTVKSISTFIYQGLSTLKELMKVEEDI